MLFYSDKTKKRTHECVRFRGFVELRLYKVTKQRLFALVFRVAADVAFTG